MLPLAGAPPSFRNVDLMKRGSRDRRAQGHRRRTGHRAGRHVRRIQVGLARAAASPPCRSRDAARESVTISPRDERRQISSRLSCRRTTHRQPSCGRPRGRIPPGNRAAACGAPLTSHARAVTRSASTTSASSGGGRQIVADIVRGGGRAIAVLWTLSEADVVRCSPRRTEARAPRPRSSMPACWAADGARGRGAPGRIFTNVTGAFLARARCSVCRAPRRAGGAIVRVSAAARSADRRGIRRLLPRRGAIETMTIGLAGRAADGIRNTLRPGLITPHSRQRRAGPRRPRQRIRSGKTRRRSDQVARAILLQCVDEVVFDGDVRRCQQ